MCHWKMVPSVTEHILTELIAGFPNLHLLGCCAILLCISFRPGPERLLWKNDKRFPVLVVTPSLPFDQIEGRWWYLKQRQDGRILCKRSSLPAFFSLFRFSLDWDWMPWFQHLRLSHVKDIGFYFWIVPRNRSCHYEWDGEGMEDVHKHKVEQFLGPEEVERGEPGRLQPQRGRRDQTSGQHGEDRPPGRLWWCCVDSRYKAGDQRGEDEDGLPVEQGWVLVEGDQVSAIPGKENGLLGPSDY